MTSPAKTVSCICGEMPATRTRLSRVFVALLRLVRDLKRGSVAAIVARVKLPSADEKRSRCAKTITCEVEGCGVYPLRSGAELDTLDSVSGT